MAQHQGYSSGHSWYYHLGGAPLFPKQIREETRASGYRGYARDDIEDAGRLAEPKRSQMLRGFQARFRDDLRRDLSRYRECVRNLRLYRVKHTGAPIEPVCDGVHVAISLKHNHLVNDFAHLIWLDELLSRQRDLFDF
jgi:hypothetical protein